MQFILFFLCLQQTELEENAGDIINTTHLVALFFSFPILSEQIILLNHDLQIHCNNKERWFPIIDNIYDYGFRVKTIIL